MKKTLLFGINIIALMVFAQMAFGQPAMPAAITIDPGDGTGTGWEEITLTVDPALACTPSGKGSVAGAAKVFMHSAAVLFDGKANFDAKTGWGSVGIDYNAEPKDGIHTEAALLPVGDGTYSITFTPGDYYGVAEGSTIIGITAVFNAGSWDNECKDNADVGCGDFFIPLTYTEPVPALLFKLDLTYQEELGNFDKDVDKAYVIIDGTDYDMGDPLSVGIFPVAKYEYLMKDGLVEGTGFTYKFKMGDTEETVEARKDTVTGSQLTLSHFFNDEEAPVETGSITFKCNLKYFAREDRFDPSTQYVDVAGSLNGWDGTNHHLTDADGDSIWEITVEDLTLYEKIEFKFRIDGSWDAGMHDEHVSNRIAKVRPGERTLTVALDNYIPGWVPVKGAVNMSRAEAAGLFDPEMDYVDVAGTPNSWSGSEDLTDADGNLIYITNNVIAPAGDTAEYKYRINSSWDAGYHDGGNNRKFYVADTTGGVVNATDTVWFDNIALYIDSPRKTNIQEVSVYPNPVQDRLYIDNTFEVERVVVVNVLGQVIRDIRVDSQRFMTIDVSDLGRGIYVLSVYGEKGYKGTAKFMVK